MAARVLAAILLIGVGAAGVLVYQRVAPAGETGQAGPGGGRGGFRPGGFGAQPMRVNSADVARADIAESLQIRQPRQCSTCSAPVFGNLLPAPAVPAA